MLVSFVLCKGVVAPSYMGEFRVCKGVVEPSYLDVDETEKKKRLLGGTVPPKKVKTLLVGTIPPKNSEEVL